MNNRIQFYLNECKCGKLDWLDEEAAIFINSIATEAINNHLPDTMLEDVYAVLLISNILYNNTTRNILPLEDGIYDMLVVLYNNKTKGMAPVGAPPIDFKEETINELNTQSDQKIQAVVRISGSDGLFYNNFIGNTWVYDRFIDEADIDIPEQARKARKSSHKFPELVGTLNKCKFVLVHDAAKINPEWVTDDRIGIFERDFFNPLINRYNFDDLICTIKYDGVSVELVIDGDEVIEAYSRGDTANDEAADLSYMFAGIRFPNAKGIFPKGTIFGMKCECIITYDNLDMLSRTYGKTYKNARNAVTGLIGTKDGRKYLPYLTLVPLRTSGLNIVDRVKEIEFLNKYYTLGIDLHYAYIQGPYNNLLFQVHKFVDEAEMIRPHMPFMYDGVVVELTNWNLKQTLGRTNSVDNWATAIKFNSKVKETIFRGYTFSVGQNGVITPKAYFNPVEFNGTIHDNTTAHSYQRFMQLGLKVGDMVNIEYRSDVICYINKPHTQFNMANPNPVIPFPETCPCCGTPLVFTEKSAICPNINCKERNIQRIKNMLKKINIKDFSEKYIDRLGITSLNDFLNYDLYKAQEELGPVLGQNLLTKVEEFKNTLIPDYRMMGAIGFSSTAQEKWKLIMKDISIESIIQLSPQELFYRLTAIKGIGEAAANTIIQEREFLKNDLITISQLPNIQRTLGQVDNRPQVRFTGIRDTELEDLFINKGFDADGSKTVTKQTAILIVPYEGFTSTKMNKISPTCMVMTPDMARYYLDSIG